ncbi:MAG: hypothetical protein IT374_15065 [Polyangiaceae bacterium]|nr:hypothetical protein [Polyangiaceae bacterium]
MVRASVVVSLAVSVVACQPPTAASPVTYRVRWHTAVRPARATGAAVVCFAGDAKTVDEAGGTFLGKIIARGREGATERDLERAAAQAAAKGGGTHVFLVDERDTQLDLGTVETRSSTGTGTCWSAVCVAQGSNTMTTTRLTSTEKTRVFAVYAVPLSQWGDLPKQLRPARLAPSTPTE